MLVKLQVLVLVGCEKISNGGLKAVAELKLLRHLNLDFCLEVTDVGLVDLTKLKNLQHLGLNRCSLTNNCLQTLVQFNDLRNVAVCAYEPRFSPKALLHHLESHLASVTFGSIYELDGSPFEPD